MLHDIHSHTYYSFCGKDDPHLTINAAVEAGYELFGISDHNYGVTRDGRPESLREYYEFQLGLRAEYADRIKVACGIEVCTLPGHLLTDEMDVSFFDYALVENIDSPDSIIRPDENNVSGIFVYAERLGCKVGLAHSDLIGFARRIGIEPLTFLSELAAHNIFWEMNVSYDSIHNYREHQYVKDFRASAELQNTVRRSGIEISVGFDGHRIEDYRPDRVREMCEFLDAGGFKTFSL